jgi:hypothetical protein
MKKAAVTLAIGVFSAVIAGLILAKIFHIGDSPTASNSKSSTSHQSGPAIVPDASPSSVTVHPSPTFSPPIKSPAPVPANQCVFLIPNQVQCTSPDPKVTLKGRWFSSALGCTFTGKIMWGDGSPEQTVNFTGGPEGSFFIATHTYRQKGSFAISIFLTVTSGPCVTANGYYSFTRN